MQFMMSLKEKSEKLREYNKERIAKEKIEMEEFLKDKTSIASYMRDKMLEHPDLVMVTDDYSKIKLTYKEANELMDNFASGLQELGISKGDFVALFSENHGYWPILDEGIMRSGAISTIRGSNAPIEELDYILYHTESKAVIFRDSNLFNKMKNLLNPHKLLFAVIVFSNSTYDTEGLDFPVFTFEDIIEKGKNREFIRPEITLDDTCSMLYTSGTTGLPKGVLLTNKNIVSQFLSIDNGLRSKPGENTLQILPVWHTYERIAEMYYMMSGCNMHYTNLSGLKNDLAKYNISTFMSVPRIWEAIRLGIYQKLKQKSKLSYYLFDFAVKTSIEYKIHKMYSEKRLTNKKTSYKYFSRVYHKIIRSFIKPLHCLFCATLYKKIRQATGMNFRASISGGGAISMKDELFYDAIGINLRVGYGLTETSPVLTLRNVGDRNYLGCVGTPFKDLELKIVDPVTKEELDIFTKGLIMVRGPQVMKGYYKDETSTKAVLSEDGWFNTGDLGWLTGDNNLVIVGKVKETIVLSNGENVEPVPIEEACLGSPYIDQIVLVGQDENSIGALVVPSQDALEKCGILAKDLKSGKNLTIKNPDLRNLIKHEINSYIKNKANLRAFEKIKQFEILKDSFNIDNGMMSQTAKIKRNNVFEKYHDLISKMFADKDK